MQHRAKERRRESGAIRTPAAPFGGAVLAAARYLWKSAREFNVSKMTIRRDVMALTCSYPIETVSGRYGGVRVAKWYRPGYRPSRVEPLTPKQAALLKKLREQLSSEDLETMDSILIKFSP